MSITINRREVRFYGDPKRVIVRFFFPGPDSRINSIIQKVIDAPIQAAKLTLNHSLRDFSTRHRNISKIFKRHFERAKANLNGRMGDLDALPEEKKLLIGSYFTSEYSIESAAFFNPSIVEDPDQSGLQVGQKRVIISFRATGEGHISSLVFRSGILDAKNQLHLKKAGTFIDEAETVKNFIYNKDSFARELEGDNIEQDIIQMVMNRLPEQFDYNELNNIAEQLMQQYSHDGNRVKQLKEVVWAADQHYEISFSLDTGISDRVIFPIAANESNGIEDARFVKFTADDGLENYYATYTAYNGRNTVIKLIETRDFYHFNVMPLYGEQAQNKGMALFPRKINGKYAMLARVDGVNNYIMFSDDINVWNDAILLQQPKFPWEFIQVGNCGSPIETPYGWLVITHGVGAMRKYCIGALMLDLNDPTKIIGQLSEPLIAPDESEREGYVPNVVYSCGSIIHNNELVIPYAMSDTASTYATVPLDDLLEQLVPGSYRVQQTKGVVSKGSILVVEDEVMNQKMVMQILKSAHYDVAVASDGVVAIMELSKGKYDLVLSDIAMPNFDGYQLLDFIKQHKIDVPVAFLSGYTSQEEVQRGLSLGAVEYISKPAKAEELLAKVDKILKLQGK